MSKNYYKQIQCGQTIPLNNPYAFSVSMPTIQDVIDYEEETEESKNKIKYAYPRIVFHPYITRILEILKEKYNIKNSKLFLLPNKECAIKVSGLSNTLPEIMEFNNYAIVIFSENDKNNIVNYYSMMKHCGFMIFDREAKDILLTLGVKIEDFKEDIIIKNPEETILNILKEGYNTDNIILSNCGMNSIYAGFNAVKEHREKNGKDIVVQYGWAYSDTIQIFKKCAKKSVIIPDVSDIKELDIYLKSNGQNVSFIFLETVSNPLIAVPDIPGVYKLARRYNIPVLIDNTFATPWSVNISPYCDLIFESLTKYASGEGDLMAGAVIIPENNNLPKDIIDQIKKNNVDPYIKTINRLAFSIKDYKDRISVINKNCKVITEYFEGNEHIESLYKVNSKNNIKNWNNIKVDENSYCGVFSIIPKGSIESVYNNLELPKGPSLGTNFPLVMPYTLLAHYHETKDDKGLNNLIKLGLSPKLLRVSVGVDDPNLILEKFNKVFNQL